MVAIEHLLADATHQKNESLSFMALGMLSSSRNLRPSQVFTKSEAR